MKTIRIIALLLVLCMGISLFMACNSKEEPTEAPTEAPATDTQAPTETKKPEETKPQKEPKPITGIDTTGLKEYIDIPEYVGDKFDEVDIDLGQYSYMNVVKNTTLDEFNEYKELLETEGFLLYTTNTIGNNQFATYVTNSQIVNVMFLAYDYDESDKKNYPTATSKDHNEVRVIVDDRYEFDLPGLASDNTWEKLDGVTPSMSLLSDDEVSWPGRMGFLYQLSDGSFFIIDGGYWAGGSDSIKGRNANPLSKASMGPTVMGVLEKYAPDPNNIVIAGWFFTHIHSDHIGAFYDMSRVEEYKSKITIEKVIYNMPSSAEMANQDVSGTNLDGMLEWEETFNMAVANFEPEMLIKAHPGQKYFVRDLTMDVYTTQDILLYSTMVENGKNLETIDWHNNISVVSMINFQGKNALYLGDTHVMANKYTTNPLFRNNIKADILQVAHHGYSDTQSSLIYSFIEPKMVLWPDRRGHFDGSNPGFADNNADYYYKDGKVYDASGKEAVDSNPAYYENGKHYGWNESLGIGGVAAVGFNRLFFVEGITHVYPITDCIATVTDFENLNAYKCWDARPNK